MLYSAKFLSSATCYIQIKVCDLCFPPQLLKIAMKPKSPSQRQFYTQSLTFTLEPPLPSAILPCVCTVDMSVWSALQLYHILAPKSTLNCFANLWQFDVANVSSLWHHTHVWCAALVHWSLRSGSQAPPPPITSRYSQGIKMENAFFCYLFFSWKNFMFYHITILWMKTSFSLSIRLQLW